jgi:hypothetical protein
VRREQREVGSVVHLETAPGVVVAAAAWILDPALCAGMALGAPRVAVSALDELHHLLIESGFRRSSSGDPPIAQEQHDEKPAETGAVIREPAPAQHGVGLPKASGDEPLRTQDDDLPPGQPPVGGGRRGGGGASR